ncbi:MAG: hypothetical protein L6R43_16620, partial [Planctomycetes bacterium]|nr:hypothetical protein [Planctomycetota bacterium]
MDPPAPPPRPPMHLRPAAPVLAALLAAAPAPADPPRPGDLVVRVRVDDAPVLPSADDDPRDALVPATFLGTRAPGRSFATALAVGTPDGDRLA